ncbi:MAG: nucleotide sugar dehydrogenase [Gammaproteobacteria bacterium]
MNIAVIGGGRVGLPTAAALAILGHRVACCERDRFRRQTAAAGRAPFADSGLEKALVAAIQSGALRFCEGVAATVKNAEAALVAVPVSDGNAGRNELKKVAAAIAAARCSVLAVKSTVPPGTCEQLQKTYDICVAANPEFLRQGRGFEDCMSPSRIVVGADDRRARRTLREVYAPLINRGITYIETSRAAAEIAKLASNMFLASRTALINEIADLCEAAGGDIKDAARILAADRRIGGGYLRAGPGFGGPCLPKDGRLLAEAGSAAGIAMPAVKAVYDSNRRRLRCLAGRVAELSPPNPVVAVWGAAFKPGADSVCDSPAVEIMRLLDARGCRLRVCEPLADAAALQNALPAATYFCDGIAALSGADTLVTANKHESFSRISPAAVSRAMKGDLVFDYAGIFDRDACRRAGISLHAIGAPSA